MIDLLHGEGGRLWEGPWAALFEDDRLIGYSCDGSAVAPRVGDIHVARIKRVDRRRGVAFVETASGAEGIVDLPRGNPRLQEGGLIAVQLRRGPTGDKAAKLSRRILLGGDRVTISLASTDGARWIERSGDPDDDRQIDAEAECLTRKADAIETRIGAATAPMLVECGRASVADLLYRFPDKRPLAVRCATRAAAAAVARALETDPVGSGIEIAHVPSRDWRYVPAAIEDMLEEALGRRLPLAGGGSLLIEPCETLTAIDVNAGALAAAGGPERLAIATNIAAAAEIAVQIRLLNLSGAVVIDFLGLRARSRQRELVDRLRQNFAGDPARPWIGSMSPIGLVEMSRRHMGPTLYERFGQRTD